MRLQCTVVMPAYNEEECIEKIIANWSGELTKLFADGFRIIVINDGSKDGTGAKLDKLAKSYDKLMVKHQPNQGHGRTVLNGYRMALELDTDYVFQTDSDDQFDAVDFEKLWARRNESQFILGYRKIRHDAKNRIVISKFAHILIMGIFGIRVTDTNVPYRLMKKEFLQEILPLVPADAFAPNICLSIAAAKKGQKLLNIPVHHKERETGTVSILKWSLVKACMKSLWGLLRFRVTLLTQG